MDDLMLKAQARIVRGKQTKTLRTAGQLPAVLYGHGVASRPLAIADGEFQRVYRRAGESTLINLVVDDTAPVKVIIQAVQRHPTSGRPIHVDLHQVRMTEKLHAEIPLAFVGEAPAVKELGGVLVKNLAHVKVEALPGDLVHEIPVGVTVLKTFEDLIHVSDLRIPVGISVLDKPDEVVALVTPPRSEQELAELEQAVADEKAAVEQVEGVKKEEPTAEPTDAQPKEEADQTEKSDTSA
ncbi:MAG: 50S ribosomal protein L25 [Candidatus Kerfeldbacteria bacterium]|nr:50S ribosomal protein L25 [Candidatus Kerfeldbacteria bacterium]